MIPGSNLLAQALTVITPTQCLLLAQTGRTLNSVGQWVSTYADAVTIWASVQAVPRSVYKMMGLDWQKSYVQFYSVDLIQDLARDRSGDLLEWNGRRYEIESKNDWRPIDGWAGIVGVDVGEAVGVLPLFPLFPLSATEEDLILYGFTGRAIMSNDDYDYSWTIASDSELKSYGAALADFFTAQPIEYPVGETRVFELGITAPPLHDTGSADKQLYLYFSVATISKFINVAVVMRKDGLFNVNVNDAQEIITAAESAPAAIGVSVTNTAGTLSAVVNVDGVTYPVTPSDIPPIATALGSILFGAALEPEDIGKTYSVSFRPYAADMTLTYAPDALDLQGVLIA